jgi:hypothetical protein
MPNSLVLDHEKLYADRLELLVEQLNKLKAQNQRLVTWLDETFTQPDWQSLVLKIENLEQGTITSLVLEGHCSAWKFWVL